MVEARKDPQNLDNLITEQNLLLKFSDVFIWMRSRFCTVQQWNFWTYNNTKCMLGKLNCAQEADFKGLQQTLMVIFEQENAFEASSFS